MSSLVLRSGGMPLLLLCLLACFHRDVPADVWKYDFERRMKRKGLK
ncbi:hypothetical protein [Bacteroides gallinaceum]|uniref:Lipoprotein n=1 Tax=Bacteroides gallinaceum TaxID=1462571 RepID=A0ABT7VHE9_9BACE|nr:hypothetical protein [Bacteroides gallinaceum]MDM8325729.1 hypothetical protein [Bacteroides gallinaceum]